MESYEYDQEDSNLEDDYEEDPNEGDPEPEPPDHAEEPCGYDTSENDWYEEEFSPEAGHERGYEEEEHREAPELDFTNKEQSHYQAYEKETDCHISLSEAESELEEGAIEEELWNEDYQPPKKGTMPSRYGFNPCQVSVPYKSIGTRRAQSKPWHTPNKRRAQSKPWHAPNRRRDYYLVFSGLSKNPEVYLQWEDDMEEWLEINRIPKEEKLAQAVSALTEDAYAWWLKEGTPSFYKKPIQDWKDLKSRMHHEFVEKLPAKPRKIKSTLNSQTAYNSKSKKVFTNTLPKRAEYKTSQAKELTPTLTMAPTYQEGWQQFQREFSPKDKKVEQKVSAKKTLGEIQVSSSTTLQTPPTHTNVSISKALKDIQQLVKEAEHLIMSTIVEKGLGTKPDSEPTNGCDLKINKIQDIALNSNAKHVEVQLSQSVYNDSMTSIMHLPFSKSVEIGAGHKAVQLDTLMPSPCQEQPRDQAENKKVEQKKSAKKTLKEINVSSSKTSPAALHQGKCSNSNEFKDQTCYRCHKKGHYAATCSLRNTKILEEKIELPKTSDSLIQSDLLTFNSSIMHLSLPKEIDTGLKEMIIEKKVQATTITRDQRAKQDIIKINEEDMCLVMNTPQVERVQILIQLAEANHVSISIPRFIFTISWSDIMHLFLSMRIYTGDSLNEYKAQELVFEQARKQALEVVPAIALTLKSEADQGLGVISKEVEPSPKLSEDQAVIPEVKTLVVGSQKDELDHEYNKEPNNKWKPKKGQGIDHAILELSTPNYFASKEVIIKVESIQNLLRGTQVSGTHILIQYWNNLVGRRNFQYSVFTISISSIIHLFFPLSVVKRTGFPEMSNEVLGGVTPEKNTSTRSLHNQNVLEIIQPELPMKKIENVLNTLLIKEEPPDSYQRISKHKPPGKYLDSQRRMKPNFLSVGTGQIVLRTKHFEEGEYDEDIGSNNYQDQVHEVNGFTIPCSKASRIKEGFYKTMEIITTIKNPTHSRRNTPEEADIQGSSHDPGLDFKKNITLLITKRELNHPTSAPGIFTITLE